MRTPWYLHGVAVHAMHVKPGWKQGRCGHKQQLEHALRGARVCVAPCLMRASRAARGRNGLHADTSRMSACCLRGRRQQPAHMPSRKPTSQAGLVRGAVEHRRRPVGHGGPVQRGGRAPAAAAAAEPVAVLDAVLCGVPCQVLPLPSFRTPPQPFCKRAAAVNMRWVFTPVLAPCPVLHRHMMWASCAACNQALTQRSSAASTTVHRRSWALPCR